MKALSKELSVYDGGNSTRSTLAGKAFAGVRERHAGMPSHQLEQPPTTTCLRPRISGFFLGHASSVHDALAIQALGLARKKRTSDSELSKANKGM